ncbi:MAG: type I restriction-modification system subunit M N-terminal domain-containing protein [Betaproteobacteria bacterium]|nr:type I restriction-modification system subunit M N-terminal domain-containing protein [Betaproteobacteria bacterium]
MHWVAPTEKDTATDTLEKRLWDAADQLRANSGLTSAQYSTPVLGLIFLRFAEARFMQRRAVLDKAGSSLTAYDTEFVALAVALAVPLVTADKIVFRAFPEVAMTMDAFLAA